MRAHREFLDSLDESTSAGLVQTGSSEAYVAVYGKTQVGKTSLILELMGVAPEAQVRVSKVLRGGRPEGQSATTMATVYRRSADKRWHLRGAEVGETSYPDDISMGKALGQIRSRMSRHELEAGDGCTIFIPSDCFTQRPLSGHTVRMLDLPGTEARDAVERKYVREVAKKCLPGADLIILLGRADDLGFLRPDSLAIPGIEDWQLVPERFRIVTTYSFTLGSLHELASRNRNRLDAGIFRERLFAQLATHGIELSEDAARPERFYPLEFGDSWRNGLRGADAELLLALTPMLDGLMGTLRQDIAASADRYARLLNACSAHEVAVRIKRLKMQQFDVAITEDGQRLQDLKKRVHRCEQRENEHLKQRRKLAERLQRIPRKLTGAISKRFSDARAQVLLEKLTQELNLFETPGSYAQLVEAIGWRESVASFKRLLRSFDSALVNEVGLPRDEGLSPGLLPKPLSKTERLILRDMVSAKLEPAWRSLNAHLSDKYWPGNPFSDFDKDKFAILGAIQDASNEAGGFLMDIWVDRLGEVRSALQEEKRLLDQRIASVRLDAQKLQSEIDVLTGNLRSIRRKRMLCEKRLEQDEQSRGKFADILDQHYQSELGERSRAMHACKSTALRLVELLACGQLIDERKMIVERVR